MALAGFEEWKPYQKSLLDINVGAYKTPFQGDLVKLKNTAKNCYELLISGCCDIVYQNTKLDFLIFVGVMPVSLFLKRIYISKMLRKQKENTQKAKKDNFETPVNYSIDTINKDDFDKYFATKSVRGDLKKYFENNNERYIFLPHQEKIFDKDIIIDLQEIKSIPCIEPENEINSINDCISDDHNKIDSLFARLDYRYRDFILQKLSFYIARIALPYYKKIDPKNDQGFYSELFSRVLDDI